MFKKHIDPLVRIMLILKSFVLREFSSIEAINVNLKSLVELAPSPFSHLSLRSRSSLLPSSNSASKTPLFHHIPGRASPSPFGHQPQISYRFRIAVVLQSPSTQTLIQGVVRPTTDSNRSYPGH